MKQIKISTPATTANLGAGFDILGMALNLYNNFTISPSDTYIIEGFDAEFNNEDNTFITSYKKAAEKLNLTTKCKVLFDGDIPFCRGLGSSATLICGGIRAANEISKLTQNKTLTDSEIFNLATEIEGHPDNIAPCLYGGLTMSANYDGILIYKHIPVNKKFKFTFIIPPYTLSTKKAREVLPKEVPLATATKNASNVLFLANALTNGDIDIVSKALDGILHVPYRKNLIKDYDIFEKICTELGAIAFTISGAGPTMMVVSTESNFSKKIKKTIPKELNNHKILDLDIKL